MAITSGGKFLCLNIGGNYVESRLKCGFLCKNKIVTIFLLVFFLYLKTEHTYTRLVVNLLDGKYIGNTRIDFRGSYVSISCLGLARD